MVNGKIDPEVSKETKKEQPLTSLQACESRLVTKIRFEIERVNGQLKNFSALDYIRNSRLGSLFPDYRIACAMLNFTHKPLLTDKPHTQVVAEDIRNQSEKLQFNCLGFLLSKHLSTNFFRSVELESINDFVRLKKRDIKFKVNRGSFNIKRSKSYLHDLVHYGKSYVIDRNEMIKMIEKKFSQEENYKDLRKDIQNVRFKAICVEVLSRNKRGVNKSTNKHNTINKVFITYFEQNPVSQDQMRSGTSPRNNHDIRGYICSCRQGRRLISPCAHVASVIFYLSWAKFRKMRFPAQYLRAIFGLPNECPNFSRY